jgi:phage shock protein E
VKRFPLSVLPVTTGLLAALALGAGCAPRTPPATGEPTAAPAATAAPQRRVTEQEARALVQRGARLLDVRTPEEFAAGHMPGALNVPVDVVAARAPSELAPLDAPVVVYCRTGRRSARATELLQSLGFTQVHDLGPMPEGAGTAR